jgi:hypothetical protein
MEKVDFVRSHLLWMTSFEIHTLVHSDFNIKVSDARVEYVQADGTI